MPHAEQKVCMAKCCLDKVDDFEPMWVELPVLFSAYPVHGPSASKVNRFVSGAQVFSLHWNVFCTSGRVLWPGIVVSPLSLPSYRELKRTERGTCRGYVNCSLQSWTRYWQTYKHIRTTSDWGPISARRAHCHVKIALPPFWAPPGSQNFQILGPQGLKILTFWGLMGP